MLFSQEGMASLTTDTSKQRTGARGKLCQNCTGIVCAQTEYLTLSLLNQLMQPCHYLFKEHLLLIWCAATTRHFYSKSNLRVHNDESQRSQKQPKKKALFTWPISRITCWQRHCAKQHSSSPFRWSCSSKTYPWPSVLGYVHHSGHQSIQHTHVSLFSLNLYSLVFQYLLKKQLAAHTYLSHSAASLWSAVM